MRGEVEVWMGDKLIAKESNMIVNGAGKTIADAMTVSPSLSAFDLATSSLLDTSNYYVQAVSFGTGADAFQDNAHALDDTALYALVTASEPFYKGTGVVRFPYDSTVSSYVPRAGLPEEPNPDSTRLEMRDTSVAFQISGIAVSSVFPGNGQLVNFLNKDIAYPLCSGTVFDNNLSAYTVASVMGGFPGTQGTYSLYGYLSGTPDSPDLMGITNGSGTFNAPGVSSMDVSGFVTHRYDENDSTQGLISTAIDGDGSIGVQYEVQLGPGDLQCANMYGGIYHLGLWTIDNEATLRNGNTPPYSFSVLNNPRKYRLFARKGFAVDLTQYQDDGTDEGFKSYGSSNNLTIKWNIRFS
jgi:hypothetical protein